MMMRSKKAFATKLGVFLVVISLKLQVTIVQADARGPPEDKDRHKTCKTMGCKYLGEKILERMNKTVDPCSNFYDFVCGNYLETVPRREKYWLNQIQAFVDDRIHDLYKNPELLYDTANYLVFKELMSSCIHIVDQSVDGIDAMKTVLKELGGLPMLEGNAWNANKFDAIEASIKLIQLGYEPSMIINLGVRSDVFDASTVYLEILPPSEEVFFFNSPDLHFWDVRKSLYVKTLKCVLTLFGVNHHIFIKEMPKVMKFVDEVMKCSSEKYGKITKNKMRLPDDVVSLSENITISCGSAALLLIFSRGKSASRSTMKEDLEGTEYVYTLDTLMKYYPNVRWDRIIGAFVYPDSLKPDDRITLRGSIDVVYEFLERIQNSSKTEKRTLANYMLTNVIFKQVLMINAETQKQYLSNYNGNQYSVCYDHILRRIPQVITAMYLQAYGTWSHDSLVATNTLVDTLLTVFKSNISSTTWMDKETKEIAKDKLNGISTLVGFNSRMRLYEYDFLEGPLVNAENPLESFFKINKNSFQFELSNYRETKAERIQRLYQNIGMFARVSYAPRFNTLIIPYTILYGSMVFGEEHPHYSNFGALGSMIGRKLTQSLIGQGRIYDTNGTRINWWTNATAAAYEKRVHCFVDQYNRFIDPETGKQVNGSKTAAANMADFGGFQISYEAFLVWNEENGAESRLPGLEDYNSHQLFWISAASAYCDNRPLNQRLRTALKENQAPTRYRIIGSLQNHQSFAQDFQCSGGSFMNPSKKCSLW